MGKTEKIQDYSKAQGARRFLRLKLEAGIAFPFSNSNDLDERVVTVYEMSMGCYLPRVPILTTGWSASATIRRETRELTGEPVRLAGFGSTAKKEDARYRIPGLRAGSGTIEYRCR